MESITLSRPDGLRVTYRRMKFDFEDGFDRYWHGQSAFRTAFWNQMSTAFEPGERFFIDSARALKGEIDDAELLEEFKEFCRQEGHHTAQHLKFDRMNEAMGFDVATCATRYATLLDLARRRLSPKGMLGITCALEHFTSAFADQLFERPDLSRNLDPRVAALWYWHAIEEAEHRGTCFDVYTAARGRYLTRVGTLCTAWAFIIGISLLNTFTLLRQQRRLFTRDTLEGLGYLFGPRGALTSLLPVFLRYFKPGFHPWGDDVGIDPDTIRQWQSRNAHYIVNLDDVERKFASAAV